MAKLTLSVNDCVVSLAKQYAKRQGVSVSQMVESYLAMVVEPSSAETVDPPILRAMRGILRHADFDGHARHLANKFG
jgi:hypothetical protein